eukprot:172163-Rhodomonas_salina.5
MLSEEVCESGGEDACTASTSSSASPLCPPTKKKPLDAPSPPDNDAVSPVCIEAFLPHWQIGAGCVWLLEEPEPIWHLPTPNAWLGFPDPATTRAPGAPCQCRLSMRDCLLASRRSNTPGYLPLQASNRSDTPGYLSRAPWAVADDVPALRMGQDMVPVPVSIFETALDPRVVANQQQCVAPCQCRTSNGAHGSRKRRGQTWTHWTTSSAP